MAEAKKYSSHLINEILAGIKPLDQFKTDNKMGLAASISDLIKSKKIGKREFAKLVNKHPSEITKWLSGTHNFTIDTLSEICFVLNIQIDEFFLKEYFSQIHIRDLEVIK